MKDLREALADKLAEDRPSVGYRDLIDTMGFDVLAEKDFGSYQGDTVVSLRDGERVGILVFGYGSCSGCDEIEGIMSYGKLDNDKLRDLTALRDKMAGNIMWSEKGGLRALVDSRDAANNYWLYNDGEAEYVRAEASRLDKAEVTA